MESVLQAVRPHFTEDKTCTHQAAVPGLSPTLSRIYSQETMSSGGGGGGDRWMTFY